MQPGLSRDVSFCALQLRDWLDYIVKLQTLWWVILSICRKVGNAFGGPRGSLTNSAVPKPASFCLALFPLPEGGGEPHSLGPSPDIFWQQSLTKKMPTALTVTEVSLDQRFSLQ